MSALIPALRMMGTNIEGKPRYISPKVFIDDFDQITIGDRVVISSNVSLLTHDYSITTMRIANGTHSGGDVAVVKPICIGRNVFVGRGSLLMPGVKLGNNVIVAAGSVVRGDVPDGVVVMGSPATIVGSISTFYSKLQGNLDQLTMRQDTS